MKSISRRIPAAIAVIGLGILASGCASAPSVKQGFDFSRFHTFAVLPLDAKGTYQDPTIVARLGPPVLEAVTEALVAKGFRPVPDGEADFLVKLDFNYFDDRGRFEERRFDLSIIDRHTQAVVWSDFAQRKTDITLPESAARKAVANMLKPFPPAPPRQ